MAILSRLLSAAAILILSPLLFGIINRTKAFFGGRRGPPLLQPYFELQRLFRKGAVQSTTTTWLFRFGTVANLVTVLIAATLIPVAQPQSLISFAGDMLLFAYLLALGRFFLVLSALDTGSAFEGMGVAREITFACFIEPTVLFCLMVLASVSGSLRMADLFSGPYALSSTAMVTPLLLVFCSWFLLTLAENCRIPFDDPSTHLELTMIHEVIVLDHSGPMLGLIQYAAALKLFIFAALGVRLSIPLHFGFWADWGLFLAGLALMAVALGVVESVIARLRMTRVAHLLTAAGVIAAFGFVLVVTYS
jgi:formate hydrogenlyase subunit 4